jgi:hypothetical protein
MQLSRQIGERHIHHGRIDLRHERPDAGNGDDLPNAGREGIGWGVLFDPGIAEISCGRRSRVGFSVTICRIILVRRTIAQFS